MKINNISKNISFSGIMLENRENMNMKQKEVIRDILSSKIIDETLVKGLEKNYSDIYITAKTNGNIELKVLHAAGLSYNYIPKDNKGNRLKVVLQHNILKKQDTVAAKVKLFAEKINKYIIRSNENPYNRIMERNCENLSERDMLSRHQKVSRPEFLPDAECCLGNQQVETKERKGIHYADIIMH